MSRPTYETQFWNYKCQLVGQKDRGHECHGTSKLGQYGWKIELEE